jgi:hypothetical protein
LSFEALNIRYGRNAWSQLNSMKRKGNLYALRLESTVMNKAVYLAVGRRPEGRKEVLGFWIEQPRQPNSGRRSSTTVSNAFEI